MPRVRPLHYLALFIAVPFLNFADKFVVVPFNLLQVIIGKLAPFLLQFAFEPHPLSLELISIHRILLLYIDLHWGQIIRPETGRTTRSLPVTSPERYAL